MTGLAPALAGLLLAASAAPPGSALELPGERPRDEPQTFSAVSGRWTVVPHGGREVLAVDGRGMKDGPDYPLAVATRVADFRGGELRVRFKPLSGRIDQGAGIAFALKPNGDYLALRANALEDNLVLWRVAAGKRRAVASVERTPTPTGQWHELRVTVRGGEVTGYLDGRKYLAHRLAEPVSGRVGLWSKSDSYVLFEGFRVTAGP